MNKKIVFGIAFYLHSLTMLAGGILENTNQSINFLRNPSRDATIGIDGVYSNPAGVAFVAEGWHAQFNWMMVHQDRDTWSGYSLPDYGQLLSHNASTPTTEATNFRRKYEGDVDVPIQPSLFLIYNKPKWSFQFGFGFVGGGGGCEFKKGLGSFESLAALAGISALGQSNMLLSSYNINSYMKGTSYDLGISLGAARKINDKLSAYVGLRGIVLMNKYEGFLKGISFMAANGITANGSDYVLDCRQNAFGIAPIIGLDYRINEHWNLAVKYEFRTKLEAKTDANNNDAFNQLATTSDSFGGYTDGASTRQDLPPLFSFGVQYSPLSSLRLCGGYHRYLDSDTKQFNKEIVGDTNEMTLGVEYDVNKTFEVSCGMQRTWYHVDDSFESDANFILNSYSLGCGVGVNLGKIKLNVAYFQTNYKNKEVLTTEPTGMTSSIKYRRSNRILGVGIDFRF
ncbi:MAG: hypothetical protein MJZ08_02270 [Bacteroidaceae bacterium]|nr:hypothetical protein [Bacteroidaceae bacterium]